ncbi:MAG: hypothetical protein A3H57_03190 [Candidatus Taylorbacteria bacterium RIFCSPLOWO2_02_FULL_43_11]|nr:MAG: hypothetical protein A3H57_03190 [Candidatus Taylorbacteria bacterium RIFCSPLOWO2_02_FULL_43_11]
MTSKLINKTKNGRGNDTRGAGGERRRVLMDTIGVAVLVAVAALATAPGVVKAATLRPGTETGLVGWWKFDEGSGTTAADASINDNRGTLSGTTKPTWVSGKHGKALSFDGSSGYVDAGNTATLNFGTGSFSYGVWVNPTGNSSTYDIPIWKGGSSVSINGFDMELGSAAWTANISDGVSPLKQVSLRALGIYNKWTHLFVVVDRSANRMIGYVNGVAVGVGTDITGFGSVSGSSRLKMSSNGSQYFFLGSLDDVRIYNRALSATEVYNLYKSGETIVNKIQPVRLNQGLVGYWSFDGNTLYNNVADLSGSGNHGLLQPTNATSSMKVAGKIGQGVKINGVNQYVKGGNAVSVQPGQKYSMSIWFKPNRISSSYSSSIAYGAAGVGSLSGITLEHTATGMRFRAKTDTSAETATTVTTLADNTWHHAVGTREGATFSLYIDGAFSKTMTLDTGAITATNGVTIGAVNYGANVTWFKGVLDEARIYNRALNPSEIKALYNMGQATINKTPVNRLKEGLVGYWTFDGKDTATNIKDVSGNGNHGLLQPTNATSSMKVAGKIGQGLKFNGSTQYVKTGNSSALQISGQFTISAWVKSAKTNSQGIITKHTSSDLTGTGFYLIRNGSNLIFAYYDGSGNQKTASKGVITNDKWSLFTAYYDGSYIVACIDSVCGTPTPVTGFSPANAQNLTFGAYSYTGTINFNGLIDDVRIYNRALSASEVKQLYNMGR